LPSICDNNSDGEDAKSYDDNDDDVNIGDVDETESNSDEESDTQTAASVWFTLTWILFTMMMDQSTRCMKQLHQ